MAASIAKRQELKNELEALKKLADDQAHHFVKARQLLHEGLCRVYLLWREASKQTGLLEELYDECSIQYKRDTIHLVTFSPLLRYLWGMDGSVNSNTIDQWNRALNALHTVVVSDKEYYKANTLSKLVSYISTNGGITALAGYSPDPIDKPTESKSARKAKSDAFAEAKRQAEHLQRGKLFFATGAAALSKFQTGFTLPAADSGLSLALIRKTKSGYDLVGAIDDKAMIEQAIVASYKRNSKPLPNTVKVLTEVIRTQTLPYAMRSMSAMLADSSKYKTDDGKTVMKQLKRLLYVASSGTFVLSANRSQCSVVTVAKPTTAIIDTDEDVALAVGDRTYIENNLIHTGDFNFYSADAADLIPAVEDETASHRLQLENTVTKRYRFIRFYPLSAFQFPPSKTQAALHGDLKSEASG